MAEPAVGDRVTLAGTIVDIEGNIALVRMDKSWPEGDVITVRLGKLPAAPYDTVHGDEDLIRDAMAEAQDNPGRTITR